jgi:hypothetical protein
LGEADLLASAVISEYVDCGSPLALKVDIQNLSQGAGFEFLTRPSMLSDPFYSVRPPNIPDHLPSIQMMAVAILPTSLPLDASKHFSDALFPYLMGLIGEYRGDKAEGPLDVATVVRAGDLVENIRG